MIRSDVYDCVKIYINLKQYNIKKEDNIFLKEFKDLTGMTFNKLTVIEYAGKKNYLRYWLCECSCEKKTRKEVMETRLINNITKSCGCIRIKTTEEYKLELELINKERHINLKLKDGVEYVDNNTKITHICTCGKEWDVMPSNILTNTKSCGLCITFEDWCLLNNRQDMLDKWDYDLNKLKPNKINYGTNKKYYFKCPRGIHKSELKNIHDFTSEHERNVKCNQCNSFECWCIDNDKQDVLNLWDYELNDCKPKDIFHGTTKKYYFKCPKGIHKSELKNINNITSGQKGSIECNQCSSFAQYNINNLGNDFLEKYWDYDKNIVDPWEISYSCNKKVYIKCQEKDYHGSYPVKCDNFVNNKSRCPYCVNRIVHPLDSLGTLYPQVLDIWSDKNEKSPYEYAPMSNQWVWWKCPDGKHKDYHRSIIQSNNANFRCPECQYSKGEERISNYFIDKGFTKIDQDDFHQLIDENKYNKNYYIPQKEFKGLIGLGNGLLSYDFHIPKLNLLIEYHGMQHEKYIKGFHKSKKDFEKQLEHDNRKCIYAESQNINLLIIWYWDFDRIEDILERKVFNT